MTTHRSTLLACLLTTLLTACGGQPADEPGKRPDAGGWTQVSPENFDTAQVLQRGKALAAKEALAKNLKSRLKEALEKDGPAAAVSVCREAAPSIAASVATAFRLKLGRTSFKLRSPANTAPAWASALVEKRTTEPTWLAHEDGRLAALLPIRAQALCLTCHGDEKAQAPDLRSALDSNYPDDRATGFKEGDLRGWFWIETAP